MTDVKTDGGEFEPDGDGIGLACWFRQSPFVPALRTTTTAMMMAMTATTPTRTLIHRFDLVPFR